MSAFKNTFFIVCLTIAGLFVFACGIKGPPLPPIEKTETIQTQKANETKAPSASGSNVSGDATKTPAK